MSEATDLERALGDLITVLSETRSRFHITGSLASSFYGEPRFTQDIDVMIGTALGVGLDSLITALSMSFTVDPEAARAAVSEGRLFQALHEETMIRVGFHTGEAIPEAVTPV